MTIAKLIAHKYPTHYNLAQLEFPKPEVIEMTNKDEIKPKINDLLFKEKYNYVLVGYSGSMYLCEPDTKDTFHRREVSYHPHGKLVETA